MVPPGFSYVSGGKFAAIRLRYTIVAVYGNLDQMLRFLKKIYLQYAFIDVYLYWFRFY